MHKGFTVKKLVLNAALAAMYFALSFISIKLPNMKISVSGLPVLIGALMFGPLDGFLIGLVGAFLEQLFSSYGLSPTTVLWVLPVAIRGLLAGAYAKHKGFELKQSQVVFITIATALVLTVLNTASLYADSKIWGYYTYAYVFGSIVWRFIAGVITAVVFSVILPPLLRLIRKNIKI
jgi:ECF transporter S component (folate family)